MRFFSLRTYKNLIGIYLCVVVCFSYTLFMKEIPNHIYVNEGEELDCHLAVPVSMEVTAPSQRENRSADVNEMLSTIQGAAYVDCDYTVTCKLFGIFPVKEVEVSVIPEQKVYASGRLVGIYGATSGVLVLDTTAIEAENGLNYEPAENKVMAGDYILAVNHREIKTKEELVAAVCEEGSKPLVLTLNRKGEYIEVEVRPVPVENGNYMMGIWVKDDIAGIGTMTYYTANRHFGALGHGIGDGETGNLLSLAKGSIYHAKLLGVKRGENGTPGELEGMIYYGEKNCIGSISSNDELGIYGTLDEEDCREYMQEDTMYSMGYKQEIRMGEAFILSDISGEVTSYAIQIDMVDYQAVDSNKGIHFSVTDEELLRLTGGIVQGMSGSPIIQNGKLVGAVTHVLVKDPKRGYGIFSETMLEH